MKIITRANIEQRSNRQLFIVAFGFNFLRLKSLTRSNMGHWSWGFSNNLSHSGSWNMNRNYSCGKKP